MESLSRAPAKLNHEPEALAWARKRAGYTQSALARETGISRSLICEYEAGTRNANDVNLRKIADALNCPVVALERKREMSA